MAAGADFTTNAAMIPRSEPLLTSHRGTFAIANDAGVLATVAPNGSLISIWVADTANGGFERREFGDTQHNRSKKPRLFSDGEHLILSDRNGSGLTIVRSNHESGQLFAERYTGNASGDELVAMRDGKALLLGRRASPLGFKTKTNRLVHHPGQPRQSSLGGNQR